MAALLVMMLALSGLTAMAEELDILADAEQPSAGVGVNLAPAADEIDLLGCVNPNAAETPVAEENAGKDVAIDESTFPEAEFRAYVSANFDKNGDGKLSGTEIKAAKIILIGYEDEGCTPVSCTNLQGIEYLTCLTELTCKGCGLTELDVSRNTGLTELGCKGNKLKSLNVTKNTKLIDLDCGDNAMKALDVTKNTKLAFLSCWGNKLTGLDLSKNQKLDILYTFFNNIDSVDIKNCKKLQANLKLKHIVKDDIISWGIDNDEYENGFEEKLSIDVAMKLTAGKKVLYSGGK